MAVENVEGCSVMDALAKAEADKYTKVWQMDDYRTFSPGLQALDTFFQVCKPSGRVIDFGCGSGKASLEMFKRGLQVLMVDIAENCLNADVKAFLDPSDLFFLPLCLWDVPDWVATRDWLYCADVMEHIPRDKVDVVLATAATLCRTGAFFQIACYPDCFGAAIGEPLHLTVESPDWWRQQLGKHFQIVADLSDEKNAVFHVRPLIAGKDRPNPPNPGSPPIIRG